MVCYQRASVGLHVCIVVMVTGVWARAAPRHQKHLGELFSRERNTYGLRCYFCFFDALSLFTRT